MIYFKTCFITLSFLLCTAIVFADEGMWMPQLLNALNIKDMKKNGCKLTAEQIYSINKSSLKDGIVQFGGGCTAEIISDQALILTNHHCGYSSIAQHSTVQHDYLTNGFWAMNKNEEIYTPSLTVTFINRIDDVTSKVMANVKSGYSEIQRDSVIRATIKTLETEAVKGTHYEAFIRPFYYGNEYYLFITETFRDVRLVGAPPESIGKFGGETDNWVWPRHNADFSLFRIYAGKDNKPAEYSPDNVPYKPKHFFPINIKGCEKGDFTMVYGFPGRTQEYLSSYAVEMLVNESNPRRVALREKRLSIMEEDMKKSTEIRLMYANRYAGIANYYKKWSGEMLGLKKYDAIEKKKQFEQKFLQLASVDSAKKERYGDMFNQFKKIYSEYSVLGKQMDYYTECLLGIDGIRYISNFINLFGELKKKQNNQENKFDKLLNDLKNTIPFKNLNKETDAKLCAAMMEAYANGVDKSLRPYYLDSLLAAHNNNGKSIADFLYANSSFIDNDKAKLMFSDFEKTYQLYERDPYYQLTYSIVKYYQTTVIPQNNYDELQINDLQKEYMKAQRELIKDKAFYPDANSTLRVAYGKVADYSPCDAVYYNYYTTLDGLIEKEDPKNSDYYVYPRLKELYAKKDYGPYADKNGKLRIAFTGSNHTTGGNSGSPVLNGKGELVGTNFDRNWEGTMSDVMYNPNQCRNIVLDVRFTLFLIDKLAGAGYLINEMKIIK
jgi:hypothetical protein